MTITMTLLYRHRHRHRRCYYFIIIKNFLKNNDVDKNQKICHIKLKALFF